MIKQGKETAKCNEINDGSREEAKLEQIVKGENKKNKKPDVNSCNWSEAKICVLRSRARHNKSHSYTTHVAHY